MAAGDPNPLESLWRATHGHLREGERDELVARFAFAIPTGEAARFVASCSPAGVLELGAGTGYWAHILAQFGVDVVAYDIDPPPSATNKWFAGAEPWHPVHVGDETAVSRHPERTLLLVWPTRDREWPARAVRLFHAAGGRRLIYVGEGPGGRSGDDAFHALLGTFDRCWHCAYDIVDSPCIAGITPLWTLRRKIELPHWEGFSDDLYYFEPAGDLASDSETRRGSRRWRPRRGSSAAASRP